MSNEMSSGIKQHNSECDGEGFLSGGFRPCPDCPDEVREKTIAELLIKEPQATGVPFDAAPTICHDPEVRSLVDEINKKIEVVKVNGSRYKANIYWHPLHAKAAQPGDREIMCGGCGWRIYQGDASILPKVVQQTFSAVTQSNFWVKVLCWAHRISHRLFLHKNP